MYGPDIVAMRPPQRFDPISESYTSFPSDKRGANIRQMLGRPGEAWGGQSGTNRLVVVRD